MTTSGEQVFTFETLHRQVEITGIIVAQTAFRIGMGRDIDAHTTDLPIIKDTLGRPFIPGSSMKGAMRSAVEAVARALGQANMKKAACLCTGEADEWCVSDKRRKELAEAATSDAEFAASIWSESCRVCRLFGSPWFAGKFRLSDLTLRHPGDRRPTSETRDGVAIDRDTGTAARGKLFRYDVTPAGLAFDFHASVDNPNDEELGLALMAIKLLERGDIRIGGGTSRGLGSCRLPKVSVGMIDPDNPDALVAYLMDGTLPPLEPDAQKDYIETCTLDLLSLQPQEGVIHDA